MYPKEIFEKYPPLLGTLFDAFDSNDPTVVPIALDTLGFVGSTIEGKLSLAAIGKLPTFLSGPRFTKLLRDFRLCCRAQRATRARVQAGVYFCS